MRGYGRVWDGRADKGEARRRKKGRRTEEGRREVGVPRQNNGWTLVHCASFPEDWTILALVLKVCDSKIQCSLSAKL